ncbi:hypothetical protein [Streptomyces sp. T028]|uniref:zinc ribbon domain-containing protein n=1 Tax=Streptomyces sp. T028 TaxID=3394379 RepID=UPI003A861757
MQAAQTRKFRGKNKAPKWKKPNDGQVSVIVLPLAVTDPADLHRLDGLFGAMWSLKRAVQRDARAKVDAYWSAFHERNEQGAKAVRQRLGLSREALERCAYKHLEDAGHLKHHASKALTMHMTDEVWNGVQQTARAERRAAKGLEPKTVTVPGGARAARSDGVPKQAFRRDRLSANYRDQRACQAEAAASLAEHRRHRARLVAREVIAAHGPVLVIEDCDIRTWYRLWGKRLSQTTPGMLISALKVECEAAGGRLVRASTWSTALSQHCMCGEHVHKTLRDREHKCVACGLVGKRDLVSAALAAFVRFHNVDDPKTAFLDTTASRNAQITHAQALEEALRESTTPSPNTPRGAGRVAVPRQRGASAPRTAGQRNRATPDEPRLVRDHAGTPGPRAACSPQLTLW